MDDFLNVGTPIGIHLFDYLLWSIFLNTKKLQHFEKIEEKRPFKIFQQ